MAKKKEKKGIEKTKLLVELAAELGNVADEVLSGSKSIVKTAAAGLKLLDEVIALRDVGFSDIKLEYRDLDAMEREELVLHFSKKFDIDSDRTELLIERGLDLIVTDGFPLAKKVKQIVDLIKDGKEAQKKEVEAAK